MRTALRLTVAAVACSVALEAQTLTISPSGSLAWVESAPQQVVVCTESLSDLWAPVGQTILRAADNCTLAIELAKPSQFFRLKPGAQFRDEFDGPLVPWLVTYGAPAESSKHTFTYTNGVLQIHGASDVTDGRFILQPPAFARTYVADFNISVDVVDWQDHGTEQILGIFARITNLNGYIGELWWNSVYFGNKTVLNIWDGSGPHAVEVDPVPDKDYRLIFVGVTNRLTLSLYDLSNLQTPVGSVSITNSTFRTGTVAVYCSREFGPGLYNVTIDSFAVTGTKP